MSLKNIWNKYLNRFVQLSFSITHSNASSVAEGSFLWKHSAPQFLLKPNKACGKKVSAGYYMVEISVKDASRLDSRIYVNYGKGFKDKDAFSLDLTPNSVTKRVIYLPKSAMKLRWNPAEQAGRVSSPKIKLIRLTQGRALKHMRGKLFRNQQKVGLDSNKISTLSKDEVQLRYSKLFDNRSPGFKYYGQWVLDKEPELWNDKLLVEAIQFSIVVPVYNSKPEWLDSLYKSVNDQIYSNWQLILVDDNSPSKETKSKLIDIEKLDERVSVVWRKINGHIAIATNDGLKQATGSYVLFLDHDDCLSPYALNELSSAIKFNPKAKLVYSDEDLMSESGDRIYPHFKSDWNPDLLLSHNYVTHIACYSKVLIDELGGFHQGVDGAQDYDLVLRAMSIIGQNEVVHVPKVLYHWRMVNGSTASIATAKNYATEAGLKALQKYVAVREPKATVMHDKIANFYKVAWPLPSVLPTVSVVIPTKDGLEVLKPCVDSVLSTANYPKLELIVIDNGSTDEKTLRYLESIELVQAQSNGMPVNFSVVKDSGGFNFSRLMNIGAKNASGDVLLLLNNDVEAINAGWLQAMLRHACREEIGCVGAKLLYPDASIQHAGVILGLGGYAAHAHRGLPKSHPGYFGRAQVTQNLSAVTAACLMIRKDVFESVNGFDEEFEVAYNDVDFCIRVMQAGLRNIYVPEAELIHHESKTRGEDISSEKKKRFDSEKQRLMHRWEKILVNDPYYNPNLTRYREDFSL